MAHVIQSLNPILKILEFKYLQIWHKACLSPILVTDWPQRHDLFPQNFLTPCPPRQRAMCKAPRDFTWNWGYGSNSPPPRRLGWSNSLLPGTAKVSNAWGMPRWGGGGGCRSSDLTNTLSIKQCVKYCIRTSLIIANAIMEARRTWNRPF